MSEITTPTIAVIFIVLLIISLIHCSNFGKVIINNGTFINTNVPPKEGQDHYDLIYVKNGGIVEINGGYF